MQDNVQGQPQGQSSINLFDRMIGSLDGIPGVAKVKPTTIRSTMPMVGQSETFIIQTYRQTDEGPPPTVGYTTFIEHVSASGVVRLVLPPKVTELIVRQRMALSDRVRSTSAKDAMKRRMASGFVPNFKRKQRPTKQGK